MFLTDMNNKIILFNMDRVDNITQTEDGNSNLSYGDWSITVKESINLIADKLNKNNK